MNCVFNNNSRWKPDIYEKNNNLYKTKCEKCATIEQKYAADQNLERVLYGGAGFFGEIRGPCGWKEGKNQDCCFKKCKPLWKTRLWPFKVYL